MIDHTVFAVSDNENKPIHTGSLFEIQQNDLTVVSVDGYRLALQQRGQSTNDTRERRPVSFVVPGDDPDRGRAAFYRTCDEETVHIYPGAPEPRPVRRSAPPCWSPRRLLEGEFLGLPPGHSLRDRHHPRGGGSTPDPCIASVDRVSLIITDTAEKPGPLLFSKTRAVKDLLCHLSGPRLR